jgi:uncharacterized Ntn-hydrolase superfamily protein
VTVSIAGRCARTGALGMATTSSSPAVAARCVHVRAGVGVVATQNVTDPRLGPAVLDLMAAGTAAPAALQKVCAAESLIGHRQLAALDSSCGAGVFSGELSLGVHGGIIGTDCVAVGNLLAGRGEADVLAPAVCAFEATSGAPLERRLLTALQAGLAAGGEAGPLHSAGLVVCAHVPWPVTDLRVDWSDEPVRELWRLWQLWEPQKADYLTRALDPERAPGYGVSGENP